MNNVFSFKRVGNYIALQLANNYKRLLLGLVVLLALAFFFNFVFLNFGSSHPHKNSRVNNDFFILFWMSLLFIGTFFVGTAFSDFRRKKKAMRYMMIPTSLWEKFFSEYFVRFWLFILLFPFLYYGFINIAGYFMTYFLKDYEFHSYTFFEAREYTQMFVKPMNNPKVPFFQIAILFFQFAHLYALLLLMGAIFYGRFALLKTLATLFAIGASVSLITVAVVEFKFFNFIPKYYLTNQQVKGLFFFPSSAENALALGNVALFFTQIVFISICYFKLREKEV